MNKRGFTLVEIAVSVAILGLALTTLVGLHTRMLNTYVNEKNRIKAAFYAQYLMTLLETEHEAPEAGSASEDLHQALEKAGYFAADAGADKRDRLEGWKLTREVTSVDLPLLSDALRRVTLQISWGETTDDAYSLVYLVPSGIEEQAAAGGGPASAYPPGFGR